MLSFKLCANDCAQLKGVSKMSYQNDSHKGGKNTKAIGNTKTTANKTGAGNQKAGQTAQNSQQKAIGQSFQAQDIKSLVRNQGRAKVGGQEWALKTPSWNDSALQAIISDPKFTVKAAGKPGTDGKLTLELRGHGKTLNVIIGR